MTNLWILLAQTTTPTTQGAPSGGLGGFLNNPFIPLLLALVVLWWLMSRGRSKERQRYEQMLRNLKRSDRVQTIGGIIGTVVDVRDNEVVLKVDETNNVKMRFIRSAIKEVLQESPPPETKG